MNASMISYYENYTPVGDVLVLAFCLVFMVLIHTAYINRTRNFLYLRDMMAILYVTALSDMIYHILMNYVGQIPNALIYLMRVIYHLGLFANLWLYVLYMKEPLHLEREKNRLIFWIATVAYIGVAVYEVLGTALGIGFHIEADGTVRTGIPVFLFEYLFFIIMLMVVVIRYRNRVFKQIVAGVVATVSISFMMMAVQQAFGQSSFTTATFLFPIFALLYLVHANPYDLELGTVNEGAFEELVTYSYSRKSELLMMSLFMHDFDGSGRKYPQEIQGAVRYFSTHFFKGATLFQISGGHMILVVDTAKTPDYQKKVQGMLDEFAGVYPKYHLDYKIVITKTFNKISAENDYIGLIHYLHNRMPENTVHRVEDKDIKRYLEHKYIVRELADIQEKGNLNDSRVEVYCQPVYNIRTGKYDTAEALMRLNLPEMGMVFPDRFIPIAEKYKYIHSLSLIILSKTCQQIKSLTLNGYNVRRISVNFSIYDVREEDFCFSVENIIRDSGVPFDQVAIEITESQNEKDFVIIKEKVNELKETGIKFYLDDFGTGYSNFERIMELPFDIIKFDRSLVIASSTDAKFKSMVTHLAKMFADMDYAVLYEGVENEDDEERCIGMSAKYLQGYKYSKPIPIERLTDYFEKRA